MAGGDDSTEESGSDSGSSGGGERKGGAGGKAVRANRFAVSDSEESTGREEGRVVRSEKDKKFDAL